MGWLYFAGVVMAVVGIVNVIQGIEAVVRSGYYLVPSRDLAVNVNYTAWGWAHIVLGLLVAAAGAALFRGATWARVVAVVVAVVSIIANLLFFAAYPWWSALVIALDILVIYAVVVHGRELQSDY